MAARLAFPPSSPDQSFSARASPPSPSAATVTRDSCGLAKRRTTLAAFPQEISTHTVPCGRRSAAAPDSSFARFSGGGLPSSPPSARTATLPLVVVPKAASTSNFAYTICRGEESCARLSPFACATPVGRGRRGRMSQTGSRAFSTAPSRVKSSSVTLVTSRKASTSLAFFCSRASSSAKRLQRLTRSASNRAASALPAPGTFSSPFSPSSCCSPSSSSSSSSPAPSRRGFNLLRCGVWKLRHRRAAAPQHVFSKMRSSRLACSMSAMRRAAFSTARPASAALAMARWALRRVRSWSCTVRAISVKASAGKPSSACLPAWRRSRHSWSCPAASRAVWNATSGSTASP
mmetsp:Transcript_42457/g.127046  ORF Transcript_42457/g.127046 Transcript_42457/m.127046 type:complete len:347 (+) Transcript_42457:75-1115(+)